MVLPDSLNVASRLSSSFSAFANKALGILWSRFLLLFLQMALYFRCWQYQHNLSLNACLTLKYRRVAVWYQSSLITGVVVFPGDSGVLSCPLGLVTPMFWSLVSDGNKQITSYIISPVVSVKVHEPWKSRGWNVDETNGDLVIPEVMLVDEGVYQCRNTTISSLVILRVYGESQHLHN